MYLVTNISGKVLTMPKSLAHIGLSEVPNNWAVGQADFVSDEVITYYQGHTDAFAIGGQTFPGMPGAATTAYQTNTATTAATVTATNITGGGADEVTLNMTGTLGAGAALTLPLASALWAALPNAAVGSTYKLRILNGGAGAFAWTVTTNTGWTLNGTMTVAQNTVREFYVTLAAASTATLQSIGTFAVTAV